MCSWCDMPGSCSIRVQSRATVCVDVSDVSIDWHYCEKYKHFTSCVSPPQNPYTQRCVNIPWAAGSQGFEESHGAHCGNPHCTSTHWQGLCLGKANVRGGPKRQYPLVTHTVIAVCFLPVYQLQVFCQEVASQWVQATTKDCGTEQVEECSPACHVHEDSIKGQHHEPVEQIR